MEPVLWVKDDVPYHRKMLEPVLEKRKEWLQYIDKSEDRSKEGEEEEEEDKTVSEVVGEEIKVQFGDYDYMEWDKIMKGKIRASCYCTRKGLCRKAHLAAHMERVAIEARPEYEKLSLAIPKSYAVELYHPEYIDEAISDLPADVFNAKSDGTQWILKLSMIEKARDVLIFNDVAGQLVPKLEVLASDGIREFVVQQFIHPPKLVFGHRKFSMRVYVLCVGDLHVLIWNDIYCFVAMDPYPDLNSQSTNSNNNDDKDR